MEAVASRDKDLAEHGGALKAMKAKLDNCKVIIKKLDKEGKYLAKRK